MSHQTLPHSQDNARIAIIGAGVFGLSTALELASRGYNHVTIIDRYPPPAPDGSSVDVSRVIRNDYADPLYARLASEALKGWETDYAEFFHRSGYIYSSSTENPYLTASRENVRAAGLPCEDFSGLSELKRLWPGFQGTLTPGISGYKNPLSGWADAAGAIGEMARRCVRAGVNIVTGTAVGFVFRAPTSAAPPGRGAVLEGMRTAAAGGTETTTIQADAVIVAAGAWTNQLVDLHGTTTSAAQPVAFVRLSEDEAEGLRGAPVFVDIDTGFFSFPPTPGTNLLKVVRHGWGYERRIEVRYAPVADEQSSSRSRTRQVSSPNLAVNGRATAFLPEDAERDTRAWMRKIWPRFAERKLESMRLCWYSDTQTNDFIVDSHPDYHGVFLATAGSGHAFKFLPTLGKYTVDCLLGTADPELKEKWAFKPGTGRDFIGDGSRGGPKRRELDAVEKARL